MDIIRLTQQDQRCECRSGGLGVIPSEEIERERSAQQQGEGGNPAGWTARRRPGNQDNREKENADQRHEIVAGNDSRHGFKAGRRHRQERIKVGLRDAVGQGRDFKGAVACIPPPMLIFKQYSPALLWRHVQEGLIHVV